MAATPIMRQKAKGHAFVAWVDPEISGTIYIFAHEGSLERAFLEVGHSSNWGVLIPEEDQKM